MQIFFCLFLKLAYSKAFSEVCLSEQPDLLLNNKKMGQYCFQLWSVMQKSFLLFNINS